MVKQRVVIITGAVGGLGSAMTKKFIKNEDIVCLLDISQEKLNIAVEELGKNAKGYVCDVTCEKSVSQTIQGIIEEFQRIDVLVNNAGIQYRAKVEDFPLEKWQLLIDVMLTGVFLMTKHAFPQMKSQKFGRIINISSVHGKMASPEKVAYVAAKHGVIGVTSVTAIEGAPFGITVNSVLPGPVKTPLLVKQLEDLYESEGLTEQEALPRIAYPKQAMNRFIEATEIADTVFFLASDEASAITMEHIKVAGGI
ncbi:SDR family NAD(P)-dependent oxidoreductase [Lysinibacillus yapensis]|uniref:SDR family NAD(P)-dependent oxidoreductase n=2 Tax=Ureibacillus yapensis TaxID=2304605 RepID=A0A396SGM6_9BACL|nr:SDR family NAD(P)-dependent oxidoreductase [Lysinibacillus yapensis]